MSDKVRLDVLLVEQGLYESREKAKSAIMAGLVYVDGEKMDKAGTKIPRNANLQVKGSEHPYVGRGGLKLKKAIDYFQIDFTDKVVLDIGASTGGFTDRQLQVAAAMCMRSMSVTTSWPGHCARTRGSVSWNAPTSAM